MSQNLQNFVKFQKFQFENLVDFEKCCKTHIFLQKSVPIQPKTNSILPNVCQKLATTLRAPRRQRLVVLGEELLADAADPGLEGLVELEPELRGRLLQPRWLLLEKIEWSAKNDHGWSVQNDHRWVIFIPSKTIKTKTAVACDAMQNSFS